MSRQDPNGSISTPSTVGPVAAAVKSETVMPTAADAAQAPASPVASATQASSSPVASTAQADNLSGSSSSAAAPGPLELAIAARAQQASQAQYPADSPHAAAASVLASAAARMASDVAQGQGSSTSSAPYMGPPAAAAAPMKSAAAAPVRQPAAGPPSSSSNKTRYKKRTKKYNNFNIFFMLERQLLLSSRGGGINAIENPVDATDHPMTKHKPLNLPPLCRRYEHLPLTNNWFLELLASQNKKRPHRKSHGLIPFKELAQTVAKNYREIDDATQSFVNEVAERLGWHCEEIELAEENERIRHKEEMRVASVIGAGNSMAQQIAAARMAQQQGVGGVGAARMGGAPPKGVLGASLYAGKKRKDAPVVYQGSLPDGSAIAGNKGLSRDEAATVQQLMGMKSHSPTAAQAHGHFSHSYPPPPGARGMAHNMAMGPRAGHHVPPPIHSGRHPMAPYPVHSAYQQQQQQPPPPSRGDVESDFLQIELAQAMNARLESERRIMQLKDQMTVRRARQATGGGHPGAAHPAYPRAPPAAGHHLPSDHPLSHHPAISQNVLRSLPPRVYEQALSMLSDRAPAAAAPQRPHSNPASSPTEKRRLHPSTMASLSPSANLEDVEKALLNEALSRGLIPPGAGAVDDAAAQFNKRPRHSPPANDAESGLKKSESHEEKSESPAAGGRQRSASEIGFYNDLYSKLAAGNNNSSSHRASSGAPAGPSDRQQDSLAVLLREHPGLAHELAGHRDPLAAVSAAIDMRERQAMEAAARDLAARDVAASRDRSLLDILGGGSSSERAALLDSLVARGAHHHPPSHGGAHHYPPSSHPSAAHYPPPPSSHYPSSHHGPSYSALLSQLATGTPPPGSAAMQSHSQGHSNSLARAEAAALASQARGSSTSPRSKPSLLEMVHAASRKSQFGLSYNDIMDVWKEMNKDRANNGGEGGSPGANAEDKKDGKTEE